MRSPYSRVSIAAAAAAARTRRRPVRRQQWRRQRRRNRKNTITGWQFVAKNFQIKQILGHLNKSCNVHPCYLDLVPRCQVSRFQSPQHCNSFRKSSLVPIWSHRHVCHQSRPETVTGQMPSVKRTNKRDKWDADHVHWWTSIVVAGDLLRTYRALADRGGERNIRIRWDSKFGTSSAFVYRSHVPTVLLSPCCVFNTKIRVG